MFALTIAMVLAAEIKSSDPVLTELMSRDLIYYKHKRAYQDWRAGGLQGFHDPDYNISAIQPQERFGNPNKEFPWVRPAGLGDSGTAKNFVYLPGPITWWRAVKPGDGIAGYSWRYPEGTVFGEVLLVGKLPFLIRTRTKKDGKWRMNEYGPMIPESMIAGKKKVTLKDKFGIINERGTVGILKKMNRTKSKEFLINTPFESTINQPTRPTSTQDSIVPKNYKGGIIKVGSQSCMRCHNSIDKHARDFDSVRDWYGRTRGNDNIFSFSIIDPSCISPNGTPRPVILNQKLPLKRRK